MAGPGGPWSETGGGAGNGFEPGAASLADLGIFTPEQFGAVGDGVTDDIASLEAFRTAAAAARGIGFLRRSYGVSRPLILSGANTWFGMASALDPAPKGAIVALGAMAAPVIIRNTSQLANRFSRMAFRAGRTANVALMRQGDLNGYYGQCLFLDALVDGVRSANSAAAPVITAFAQFGPGPAMTIAVMDPSYLTIAGAQVIFKVLVGGARDVATGVLSVDNGVTYSPTPQVISSQTQIGYPAGVNFGTSTGLLFTAAADGFVAGTLYAFNVANTSAINDAAHYDKCLASDCGIVYATAAVIGGYPGPTYHAVLATGTVSTTVGSNLIRGTGTHFLSFGARDGDQWGIEGNTKPDGTFEWLQNSVVITDTIAYAAKGAQRTLANVPFVCAVGAGFWEDVCAGSQNDTIWTQPTANQCAIGYRVGGLSGGDLRNPISKNHASVAASTGTIFAD